jgi:choline dehydrogenase
MRRCEVIRAFARRVVIENGRAVGVEVERGGQIEVIRARAEVILAASSINTPKLLMLSGIGDAAHLQAHGIAVVADRPGVGANLQDHMDIYMQFASKLPVTLYKYWNLWGKAIIGAQWLFTGKGPGCVEPVRKLRLHPVGQGGGLPRHPISLPAHRRAL